MVMSGKMLIVVGHSEASDDIFCPPEICEIWEHFSYAIRGQLLGMQHAAQVLHELREHGILPEQVSAQAIVRKLIREENNFTKLKVRLCAKFSLSCVWVWQTGRIQKLQNFQYVKDGSFVTVKNGKYAGELNLQDFMKIAHKLGAHRVLTLACQGLSDDALPDALFPEAKEPVVSFRQCVARWFTAACCLAILIVALFLAVNFVYKPSSPSTPHGHCWQNLHGSFLKDALRLNDTDGEYICQTSSPDSTWTLVGKLSRTGGTWSCKVNGIDDAHLGNCDVFACEAEWHRFAVDETPDSLSNCVVGVTDNSGVNFHICKHNFEHEIVVGTLVYYPKNECPWTCAFEENNGTDREMGCNSTMEVLAYTSGCDNSMSSI